MADLNEEKVRALKNALEDAAWGNIGPVNVVADALVRTHLTHQQRVVAFIHEILRAVDRHPRQDGRNEDAKAWVKRVLETVPEPYFPVI